MFEKMISTLTTNLATKIVSILIAIVLWIVVLGSRSIEVTKEVPLEVITSTEVIPANEIPQSITFRLSGPKAFLRAIRDRREDPIRVNLTGVKPGLVTHRFSSENIHVPLGVKVLLFHPAAILIKLEPLKKKDVPVRVELRGTPPEGYRLVRSEAIPPTVKIKGAESRVDGITEIATRPIDISELHEGFEQEMPLSLPEQDIQVDGSLPKIALTIEPTSANYRIKNVEVRVLSYDRFTLQEKNVTVFVRTSSKDLKTLDRASVYGIVDVRGKPKGQYLEAIKVNLPAGVGLVKVVPEKVHIDLH